MIPLVEGRTTKCIQLVEGEVVVSTGVAILGFCEAIQGAHKCEWLYNRWSPDVGRTPN
jgi:hypothetical protein